MGSGLAKSHLACAYTTTGQALRPSRPIRFQYPSAPYHMPSGSHHPVSHRTGQSSRKHMINGASRSRTCIVAVPVTRDWQEVDLTVTLAVAGFATICVFANTSTGTAGLLPFFPAFLLNSGLRSAATEARGIPRARRLENWE